MAYHLTGSQALEQARRLNLKPVKNGLQRKVTQVGGALFLDATGYAVFLPEGSEYRITGTRDGNGYVITYSDDLLRGTRYLTAETGCLLV